MPDFSKILGCMLLLVCLPLSAAQVENLFSVELPIADQTTALRLDAFKEAFRKVIVKVSGSREALQNPALQRPINSSARYVQQFSYFIKQPETEESYEAGQQFIRVGFNETATQQLLRENRIPVWGKTRPGTLMLLSVDTKRTTTLVSSDSEPEIMQEIEALADARGLPLLFPLLDIEDRQIFGVQDVVNVDQGSLQQAAARYQSEAYLVGRIRARSGSGWKADWSLFFSGQRHNWSNQSGSRQDLLDDSLGEMARLLAGEFALQNFASGSEQLILTVEGIKALSDQVSTLRYLESIDAVEQAALRLIQGEQVTYQVKLRNSAEDFSRLIALGNILEQIDLPQIDATGIDPTVYMRTRYLR